jgi:peptide/nickel transport system ATP-binding protein
MSDIVLEINDLTFGYNKEKLLYKNFSLILKRGEIKSIVGESGSGKSTLFELIIGEQKLLSGEIKKQNIAQVFQDPYSSFHPSYSIISQIQEVADISEIDEYLKKLNLQSNLLEKKPHQLSGGQLQRCSILRAILMKPDLLLADEPTSALDNVVQLDVMKLLVKFLDRVGILLITHDEHLAKWCSDETIEIGK